MHLGDELARVLRAFRREIIETAGDHVQELLAPLVRGGKLRGTAIGSPLALQDGTLTPPAISASQNDYNPAGLERASILRLSSTTSVTITGLAGGMDGRLLVVHNVGGSTITLAKDRASSAAANRILADTDVALSANQAAVLQYDAVSSRWRVVACPVPAGGGGGGGGGGGATIIRTTYASRPAAGIAGRYWIQSNGPYRAYDDGTTWREEAFGWPVVTTGMPATWLNQNTATVDTSRGGQVMIAPAQGSPDRLNARIMPVPSPPYTLTALVQYQARDINGNHGGIVLYDNGSGRLVAVQIIHANGRRIFVARWNNPDSWNADQAAVAIDTTTQLTWLRIIDDGTNRTIQWSYNATAWDTILTVSRTDWITPTHAGFHLSNRDNPPICVWLLSWEFT